MALPRRRAPLSPYWLYPWISVALLLAAWQVVGSRLNPILVSTPSLVVAAAADLLRQGSILGSFWDTCYTFVIGLLGGMLVGAPVGILMGRYRTLSSFLDVIVRVLYSLPVVALFPLLILWVGLGTPMRIVVVFLSAVLPALISAQAGVRNVDRVLIEVARVFGARESEVFGKIIVPASVPFIASGFKIAIGRAIVTTIAVELLTSIGGLGGMMAFYGNQLKTAYYFVPLVLAALLSLVVYQIGDRVEAHFSRWAPSRDQL